MTRTPVNAPLALRETATVPGGSGRPTGTPVPTLGEREHVLAVAPLAPRARTGRRRAERRGIRASLRGLGRAGRLGKGSRRLQDVGMATAEYAIATLAACGFAALLLGLLRSGEVRGLLFGIIRKALAVG